MMQPEKRKYPKVNLHSEAHLFISGDVKQAKVLTVSPSGLQMECRRQIIERMSEQKRDSGLFPDFDLEFSLPTPSAGKVKSSCNVAFCRRLSQDRYHVGFNFVQLSESDQERVSEFIRHCSAA